MVTATVSGMAAHDALILRVLRLVLGNGLGLDEVWVVGASVVGLVVVVVVVIIILSCSNRSFSLYPMYDIVGIPTASNRASAIRVTGSIGLCNIQAI